MALIPLFKKKHDIKDGNLPAETGLRRLKTVLDYGPGRVEKQNICALKDFITSPEQLRSKSKVFSSTRCIISLECISVLRGSSILFSSLPDFPERPGSLDHFYGSERVLTSTKSTRNYHGSDGNS